MSQSSFDPITIAPSATALALAKLAHSASWTQHPREVTEHALKIVRDTLGVMLGGSTLAEVRKLAAMAPGLGAGDATIFGISHTAAAHVAALVNGTGGVSLELDEGNQYAVNHPSIHMLPALWALAEEQGASGAQLMHALIVGYEIGVRVGAATQLRQSVHPFGSHTIVGTAAGAAVLQGMDIKQTATALEIAAGLCIASSQNAANAGASVRNLFTGFTNHNGLLAVRLAKAGFSGEPGALESVFGKVLGSGFDLTVGEGLAPYYITRNYFKIYACSRWNHAPIEAAARIMADGDIALDAIEAIDVHTFDPATRLSGTTVANGYAAKHSIPYNVAAQVVYGSNSLEVYTDAHVQDARVQALLGKIRVLEDPALTALLPGIRAGRVTLRLSSGEVRMAQSEQPKGGFDNPLSEQELLEKFRLLAGMALPAAQVEALLEAIAALPGADSVRTVSGLLKTA
ncbi:MmgE/PrpD family protein [Alcaligenaceae bacterium]|nr:MmgE/PrpD family protein [Alcaligenaceae bacterium]